MKVLLLAVLALSAAFFAPSASAEECGGTLNHTVPAYDNGGQRVGTLYLYYNGNTGINCAVMNHAGYMWGVGADTGVQLDDCTGACATKSGYSGYQLYRAGPARAYGRGRCIRATGWLDYGRWGAVRAYSGGC